MIIPTVKIIRPIDLGDYAEELRGVVVYVWVNPPRDVMQRYYDLVRASSASQQASDDIQASLGTPTQPALAEIQTITAEAERTARGFLEWWAEIFSQHKDAVGQDSHFSAEGLAELMTSETDPGLYSWLCGRAGDLIREHRSAAKKK